MHSRFDTSQYVYEPGENKEFEQWYSQLKKKLRNGGKAPARDRKVVQCASTVDPHVLDELVSQTAAVRQAAHHHEQQRTTTTKTTGCIPACSSGSSQKRTFVDSTIFAHNAEQDDERLLCRPTSEEFVVDQRPNGTLSEQTRGMSAVSHCPKASINDEKGSPTSSLPSSRASPEPLSSRSQKKKSPPTNRRASSSSIGREHGRPNDSAGKFKHEEEQQQQQRLLNEEESEYHSRRALQDMEQHYWCRLGEEWIMLKRRQDRLDFIVLQLAMKKLVEVMSEETRARDRLVDAEFTWRKELIHGLFRLLAIYQPLAAKKRPYGAEEPDIPPPSQVIKHSSDPVKGVFSDERPSLRTQSAAQKFLPRNRNSKMVKDPGDVFGGKGKQIMAVSKLKEPPRPGTAEGLNIPGSIGIQESRGCLPNDARHTNSAAIVTVESSSRSSVITKSLGVKAPAMLYVEESSNANVTIAFVPKVTPSVPLQPLLGNPPSKVVPRGSSGSNSSRNNSAVKIPPVAMNQRRAASQT